jgi:preprotein translocase subunit SecY
MGALQNVWKVSGLRNRILFTLGMFLIYRFAAHIPVPGVNAQRMSELVSQGGIFGFLDLFAGGAIARFSVVALGITPYINSSIVMQLLTMVIPTLERWNKEEEGRHKIKQYTRYGTVFFAAVQAIGMAFWLRNYRALTFSGPLQMISIVITLTAGTIFLMWIGERITEKGIGQGISLLIFASIVSRIPAGTAGVFALLKAGTISIFNVLLLVVLGVIVIFLIVKIQEGQRRIPVQYAKRVVGRKMYGGQSSFIPIRINPAGVIPIIFAISILTFPQTIATFFPNWVVSQWLVRVFDPHSVIYLTLYGLLILFFTYFYTAVTFNPVNVSDNIKKYGGFIPGIRPGKPTSDYIAHVVNRLVLAGGIFLALVAILPDFAIAVTKIPNIRFGGTSLLIVVGVALDTMKQVETHLLMRHYQGFLKQ